MSFLDALNEIVDDEIVIHHLFLLNYYPDKNIIHAFFEGKTDLSFYGTLIRRYMPKEWKLRTYICGNKDSVYYQHKNLSPKHKQHQPLLYFVDKDIDDIIPITRVKDTLIYVTEYYSIENYLITETAIEQIWEELFRQPSGTVIEDELVTTFSSALLNTHEILLDIMSWILGQRKQGARPNLNDIITEKYFQIDDDLKVSPIMNKNEMIELLETQTKTPYSQHTADDLSEHREELEKYDPKMVIRGHNEMDFFISFIKKLSYVVNNKSKINIRPKVQITKANIIDIMGPRVDVPLNLDAFLSLHLQFNNALVETQ